MRKDRLTLPRFRRGESRTGVDAAIAEGLAAVEKDPGDWAAVNALGDLYVQKGEPESAVAQFMRAGDFFYAEGVFSRAVGFYKKVLRIRHDDHALLSLTDIAARQGLLPEAKQYLIQLEHERRVSGDHAGADECLASLEALIQVQAEEPLERDHDLALESALVFVDVDAYVLPEDLDESPAPADPEHAGLPEVIGPDPERPDDEEPSTTPPPPARTPPRPASAKRRRPSPAAPAALSLQDVFDRMRETAAQEDESVVARERFTRAQEELAAGNVAEAAADLQNAARSPLLRFEAAAQLGRLYVQQGALYAGIAWLERAVDAPPSSADAAAAVMYDLADALELVGERKRARMRFTTLRQRAAGFRDVDARLARLAHASQGGT